MRALTRETLLRRAGVTAGGAAMALGPGVALAARGGARGEAGHGPLVEDPAGLIDLPKGFRYRVVQTVQGIAGDQNALGYFGFSCYEQNKDQLNLIGIKADDESGQCVKPTADNIQSSEYEPLSRPIFMYPSQEALGKPAVKAFLEFILRNNDQVAEAAQAVALTDEQKQQAQQKVDRLASGGGAAR